MLLLKLELEFFDLCRAELLSRRHWPVLKLALLDLELSDTLGIVKFVSCDVEFVQPIVLVNHLKNCVVFGEKNDLAAVFRILSIAWSFLDLSTEDGLAVQLHRDKLSPSVRVDPRLIVVPDADHGDIGELAEVD